MSLPQPPSFRDSRSTSMSLPGRPAGPRLSEPSRPRGRVERQPTDSTSIPLLPMPGEQPDPQMRQSPMETEYDSLPAKTMRAPFSNQEYEQVALRPSVELYNPYAQLNPSTPGLQPLPTKDFYSPSDTPLLGGGGDKTKTKKHPLGNKFEPPNWGKVLFHLVLCALAYPILFAFVLWANGRTIFISRFIVGAGCGMVGVALGASLLALSKNILEAVTWATLIHQSRAPENPGIKLADLKRQMEEPGSVWTTLRLLWDRMAYSGTTRKYRKDYDPRIWSIYIIFFLFNVVVASLLAFLLGRLVNIDVQMVHQYQKYDEVAINGALSQEDLRLAQNISPHFESFALQWTLSPFTKHEGSAPVISFNYTETGDRLYFSEITFPELKVGGSGAGTFNMTPVRASVKEQKTEHSLAVVRKAHGFDVMDSGSIVRYPRWGIRIHCEKIPEQSVNILAETPSRNSYVFIPRDLLRGMFKRFDRNLPASFEGPLSQAFLLAGDRLPATLDPSKIAAMRRFGDNGVAHSIQSEPVSMGEGGDGFVTIETVLIRLNMTYAPEGNFPVKSRATTGPPIGYDSLVCLEVFEPWVLDVYNCTSSGPVTLRVVGKGAAIEDFLEEVKRTEVTDPNVQRVLNSTGYREPYIVAHQNSINQLLKDNGRDERYVSSPTIIGYTDGAGPYGYTELSPELYASERGLADAANMLPFFSGTGQLLARRFSDRLVTKTSLMTPYAIVVLFVVFVLGMLSGLLVPRLPLDTPRRGFDLYSLIAVLYSQELISPLTAGVHKGMTLEEVHDQLGGMKLQYHTDR